MEFTKKESIIEEIYRNIGEKGNDLSKNGEKERERRGRIERSYRCATHLMSVFSLRIHLKLLFPALSTCTALKLASQYTPFALVFCIAISIK